MRLLVKAIISGAFVLLFSSTALYAGITIVGGRIALEAEAPYQVLIRGRYLCGGSEIAALWIVTAAHCFDGQPSESQITIHTGTLSRWGWGEHSQTRVITLDSVIIHPDYRSVGSGSDIALIRLAEPFSITAWSQPVGIISSTGLISSTAIFTASGWGRNEEGGVISENLQVVGLPFVSRQVCEISYMYLPNNVVCAGYANGGKDTCQGDSGGPLVEWIDGIPILRGITSYGNGCARPTFYGIYTDISVYVAWVMQVTGLSEEDLAPKALIPLPTPAPTSTPSALYLPFVRR